MGARWATEMERGSAQRMATQRAYSTAWGSALLTAMLWAWSLAFAWVLVKVHLTAQKMEKRKAPQWALLKAWRLARLSAKM